MSSSTNILSIIQLAPQYLYQFGNPVLMLIGTVGCIFNLIVFHQKNLRKNPCSIYFIAYSLANFAYIYSSLLPVTLSLGYNIDVSTHNLFICRIRLYVTILSNVLSPFYLILASIDRIFITSPNAVTRQRSTRRFAIICVTVGTLFWTLFHSHTLFLTNILQSGPYTTLCYFQLGVYLSFITYYSLFRATIILVFMTVFGMWSIKNIRGLQRVRPTTIASSTVTAVGGSLHSNPSKDRQLCLMLLMDIATYALFSFALSIYLVYQQITQNGVKTAQQTQIENIIGNLCRFSAGIPSCISCYGNLIISKTFRTELKNDFYVNRCFASTDLKLFISY